MTGLGIELRALTVRYGRTTALDGASAVIGANTITGLLGRNGSGKTTLLSAVAALRRPTSGAVLVGGEDPFENERLTEQICIIREGGDVLGDERIATNLRFLDGTRPTWDQAYAEELLDAFRLDPRTRPGKLSRGQRSAFGAVVGLAARAPVTIFDEVHLGMDAASRRRFYDLLLADYVEQPRTVVLSSHLISEIERLLEHVVVLDAGRVVVAEGAEDLRTQGATVTGPADAVDVAVTGMRVLGEQLLGPTKQVTVLGALGAEERSRLTRAGLEVGALPLEDLFIALTEEGA